MTEMRQPSKLDQAWARAILGEAWLKGGDPAAADTECALALRTIEAAGVTRGPWLGGLQTGHADTLRETGRLPEAMALYREALGQFGERPPWVAPSPCAAWGCWPEGRPAEARLLLEEALAIWRGLLGAGHPHLVESQADLRH